MDRRRRPAAALAVLLPLLVSGCASTPAPVQELTVAASGPGGVALLDPRGAVLTGFGEDGTRAWRHQVQDVGEVQCAPQCPATAWLTDYSTGAGPAEVVDPAGGRVQLGAGVPVVVRGPSEHVLARGDQLAYTSGATTRQRSLPGVPAQRRALPDGGALISGQDDSGAWWLARVGLPAELNVLADRLPGPVVCALGDGTAVTGGAEPRRVSPSGAVSVLDTSLEFVSSCSSPREDLVALAHYSVDAAEGPQTRLEVQHPDRAPDPTVLTSGSVTAAGGCAFVRTPGGQLLAVAGGQERPVAEAVSAAAGAGDVLYVVTEDDVDAEDLARRCAVRTVVVAPGDADGQP